MGTCTGCDADVNNCVCSQLNGARPVVLDNRLVPRIQHYEDAVSRGEPGAITRLAIAQSVEREIRGDGGCVRDIQWNHTKGATS